MAQRTASTTLRNSTIAAVAGALDDPPMMDRDGRIDQIASQRPEPRQDAIFVRSREPAIADHIRAKDRRQFSGLAHRGPPSLCRLAQESLEPRYYLLRAIEPKEDLEPKVEGRLWGDFTRSPSRQ